jgi:hypothetical protein
MASPGTCAATGAVPTPPSARRPQAALSLER